MTKLPLDVARPLSLGSVAQALLDTPIVGPYPVIGTSRGDGTIWVEKSIIKPVLIEGDVPAGRKVIVSTSP